MTILRTAVHERIDELDGGSDNLGETLRQVPTERAQLPLLRARTQPTTGRG